MQSLLIFLTFNGVGFILSLASVVVIAHTAMALGGTLRRGLLSLLKGFILIALSFIWTLFFGRLLAPSQAINIQSVILSFGMAMMVYSARQMFDIYEHGKKQLQETKDIQRQGA